MKPIDMLGLGPKREAVQNKYGWLVTITPPAWVGLPGASLQLTEDQYVRYLDWHIRGGLIQDCLPDLDRADWEVLITGIDTKEFDNLRERRREA